MRRTLLSLVCSLSTSALIAPSVTLAQSEFSLEEIVVTAQRREESIQDVPVAITAFNESFLDQNDVRTIEDLNGTVPGFYATNSIGYATAPLSIRGIGGANGGGNVFNDEPVAIYINDVYISRLGTSTADLIDVSSIQVLRGPQGTLYGRNSTAGALLINTAKPSAEFEAKVKLGVAQYGEKRVEAAISGGLSDVFNARLAVGYSDSDGWADNTFNGEKIASSSSDTVRLSLQFLPTDELEVNAIYESQTREAAPANIAIASLLPGVPSSPFVERANLDILLENNSFALNTTNENDGETESLTLLVNWQIGDLQFDSVTAYRDGEIDGAQDSDGTEFTLFSNIITSESDQFSQEFRLASDANDTLSWITGIYYLQEDIDAPSVINNFQALFGAGTAASFQPTQSLDAMAAFFDATLHLTDSLSVSVGGRYSTEEKDFASVQTVSTISNSIPLPFAIPGLPFPAGFTIPAGLQLSSTAFTDTEEFSDFTPRLVVNYQINDDALAYVNLSKSFKSGGFNAFGLEPAFENEEILSYEVGYKATLIDERLRMSTSAFIYDYTDLQVRLPVPTGGVSIQNAGEAEVIGAELEFTYAMSENLRVSASASYLETELKEFLTQQVPQNASLIIGSPIALESINAKGNELTRAPELQYFLSADYSFAFTDKLEGEFNVNYKHQDEVFFLETNQVSSTFAGDAIDEIGVRLSIRPSGGAWELGLFGQNITDERTITQVSALGAFPVGVLNEPKKWGADFTIEF